jgi:hypothetical protein
MATDNPSPQFPTDEQRGRGIRHEPETRGIRLIVVGNRPKPLAAQMIQDLRGVETLRETSEGARRLLAQPISRASSDGDLSRSLPASLPGMRLIRLPPTRACRRERKRYA